MEDRELVAYVGPGGAEDARLVPAPAHRSWMDQTDRRFAWRCLPLLIANQAGWFMLNRRAVRLSWDGGRTPSNVQVEYLDGAPPGPAVSHFGHGIVTWTIPYLFRTPRGFNLLVRGPANFPKDGIYPLEGVVESDWLPFTFTMNWQLTRPNTVVTFDPGEPICMIVPQRRGELEEFRGTIQDIEGDPSIKNQYQSWAVSRSQFLADLRCPESDAVRRGWQKDYFVGLADGHTVEGHQTKLKLREWINAEKDSRKGPQVS